MADDVIGIDEAAEFAKPPFSTKKTKKKNEPEIPYWLTTPELQKPASFPDEAAAILKRNKISRKQFSRYAEQLTLFILTNFSADFACALQKGLRGGSTKHMEIFAKLTGMMKNESGVVVNLNQNLSITQNNGDRQFDSIVRMLDERDRNARLDPVITVAAIESGELLSGSVEAG